MTTGWSTGTIGEAVGHEGVFSDGDWVESKDQDPNGDVRLIQLADIGDGTFRDRSSRFLTSEKAEELGCTYLQPGDVLVARMPDPLGRACIFPDIGQPAVTAVDVCIVRPADGSASPRWLMHMVNSPEFRSRISQMQSGTTRKRISRKNLATIGLPLPPIDEQTRIVEAVETHLSRLDAGVESLKRAKRNVERMRRTISRHAALGSLVSQYGEGDATQLLEQVLVVREDLWATAASMKSKPGKYTPPVGPDAEKLPSLPTGWVWATLDQLAYFIVDYRGKTPPMTDSGIPVLSAANVKGGRLVLDKPRYVSEEVYAQWSTRGYPEPGDLLITTEAPVAETATYPDDGTYLLTRRIMGLKTNGVSAGFLSLAIDHPVAQAHLRSHQRGTTVPRILKPALLQTPIALPPEREQSRIMEEVSRQSTLLEAVSQKLQTQERRASGLRRSLLRDAFRGVLI